MHFFYSVIISLCPGEGMSFRFNPPVFSQPVRKAGKAIFYPFYSIKKQLFGAWLLLPLCSVDVPNSTITHQSVQAHLGTGREVEVHQLYR